MYQNSFFFGKKQQLSSNILNQIDLIYIDHFQDIIPILRNIDQYHYLGIDDLGFLDQRLQASDFNSIRQRIAFILTTLRNTPLIE